MSRRVGVHQSRDRGRDRARRAPRPTLASRRRAHTGGDRRGGPDGCFRWLVAVISRSDRWHHDAAPRPRRSRQAAKRAPDGVLGRAHAGQQRATRALARVQGLLGVDAVALPEVRGGRAPAEQVVLVPVGLARARKGDGTGARPRAVAQAGVARTSPRRCAYDETGGRRARPSRRTRCRRGRGLMSGPPATITADGRVEDVSAWSGPWVFDERWWDAEERRRQARMQVVTASGTAHLLVLEHRHWWVEATYD